eukprot:c24759_g1_i1 orf=167-1795(+)
MTWVVDGRTFARKVKNPAISFGKIGGGSNRHSIKGIECPSCGHIIDQGNTTQEWPGLPAGVKFDPSDQELLGHLAEKIGVRAGKPHPFIDEFIPTLDGEDGICYTHPENLPGVKCDGGSTHFFHRPARAYTTGHRKRRKIQSEPDEYGLGGEMRWHKTGKTRPVVENGKQLGCKKIMVLYLSLGKKSKPEKTNWVMHQYHLGVQEEEREGEFVVSKVFYQTQPRQSAGGYRGDDDCLELMNTEIIAEAAVSIPQSSTSAVATSFTTRAPMTPQIPTPTRPPSGKQHKGLLEIISDDVDRISALLNGNSLMNTDGSSDQHILVADFDSTAVDCISDFRSQSCLVTDFNSNNDGRSDLRCQVSGIDAWQEIERQDDQDACSPLGWASIYLHENEQLDCEAQLTGKFGDEHRDFHVDHLTDGNILGVESQQFLDELDADLMNLLCDESLQAETTFKFPSKHDAAKSFCSIAANFGLRLDDMPDEAELKADPALDNIILDTPPEFLLDLVNSQDTLDWLGKRRSWGDSQKSLTTGELNASQSLDDD